MLTNMKVKVGMGLILILVILAAALAWMIKNGQDISNNQRVDQSAPVDVGNEIIEYFPADGQRVGKNMGKITVTFPYAVKSMEIGVELNGNSLKTGRPIISEDRRTVNLPLGGKVKDGEYKVSYLGCKDSQRVFCREGEFKFMVE